MTFSCIFEFCLASILDHCNTLTYQWLSPNSCGMQDMASTTAFATVVLSNGQRKISSPTGQDRFFGIPRFVYGTAFKGDRSTPLVEQAVRKGYVGIDTASVTKNYQEKLVADGVRNVLAEQELKREDLYVR